MSTSSNTLPQGLPYNLMLTAWTQILNPIISNSILQGTAINGIVLNANTPKNIQTGLGRIQLGWFITDIISNANVWRTEPFNAQYLTLEASAAVILNIWVF